MTVKTKVNPSNRQPSPTSGTSGKRKVETGTGVNGSSSYYTSHNDNPLTDYIGARCCYLPGNLVPVPGKPKPDKQPWRIAGSGHSPIDWNNPKYWMTLQEALRYKVEWEADYIAVCLDGIQDLNLICLDLDHCITEGVVSERALRIVDTLDGYTTVSISGTGLHIWLIDPSHTIPHCPEPDRGYELLRKGKHIAELFTPFSEEAHR